MILDEVREVVEREGEEMMIENINAIDHWAKKLGITHEELYDFVEARANEVYELIKEERGYKNPLMSGWMDAFINGYAVAERMRRGPT